MKWCETKRLPLPTTAENTHRSGIKGNYPDAYAQRGYGYPDLYFTPTSATAVLDLKNAKKKGFSNKDASGLPPK